MKRLIQWLDDRTGIQGFIHEALYERIPGGARWRYVWGSSLVFVFFVQVITGFMLWMAYSPSTRTAWESVFYIQYEMGPMGAVLRGIHHFAAQAMIILMVLHLVQVVIDGAYKAPREINFWFGLILMQIVLGLGLTGYLLPWDQKGYYATQVATEIMGSTPAVGPEVQKLVQGGAEYGHHTLTRFFALHAGILPALLVAFLVLHLYVFRRHGITTPDPNRAPESTFWPDQILKDGVACLAVLAAILALAVWKGAELTAPANPAEAYKAARPEWYYLFLFRFLKFEWVTEVGESTGLGEAFGAIVIPGALMAVVFLMPLIAKIRGGHGFNVFFLVLVMLGAGGLTGVAIYEDWYANTTEGLEFREAYHEAHVDGLRTVELAQSPSGIPPEGAISLLQNDPLTQGPRLFTRYCADCHQPTALAGEYTVPAQAPELAGLTDRTVVSFGDRDWIRDVLTNFEGKFSPLASITEENGASAERAEAAANILSGSMFDWSATNGPLLQQEANNEDFEALVEFLYAQGGHADAIANDDPRFARGREIFESGELAEGSFDTACADCHRLHVVGEETEAFDYGDPPILTGYGGANWLREFIKDPGAMYGDNNAMPAFGEQLSEHDLDLLVRWMVGDYYQAESGGAD